MKRTLKSVLDMYTAVWVLKALGMNFDILKKKFMNLILYMSNALLISFQSSIHSNEPVQYI